MNILFKLVDTDLRYSPCLLPPPQQRTKLNDTP